MLLLVVSKSESECANEVVDECELLQMKTKATFHRSCSSSQNMSRFFRRNAAKGAAGAGGPPATRLIYVNNNEKNVEFQFADNTVTTAKYSLLTFIPKNLYIQFRRLANVYFAVIAGLQVLLLYFLYIPLF